jgi:hypothetical protein
MTPALYAVSMLAANAMSLLGGMIIGWCLRGRADGP